MLPPGGLFFHSARGTIPVAKAKAEGKKPQTELRFLRWEPAIAPSCKNSHVEPRRCPAGQAFRLYSRADVQPEAEFTKDL
ncbi:MAG: hypothetical protein C4576_33555 [Desulfobacteraceae bacterium]|nr:MAG: hypothetical protein C4576_33555 [Desulfobacteraceae bacterium]